MPTYARGLTLSAVTAVGTPTDAFVHVHGARSTGVSAADLGLFLFPEWLSPDDAERTAADATASLDSVRGGGSGVVQPRSPGGGDGGVAHAYSAGHWDGVISGFREATLPVDGAARAPASLVALHARVAAAFAGRAGCGAPLRSVHALELAPAGEIRAHVDSVKFSGGVIAGVSLLESAVLRLTRAPPEGGAGATGGADGDGGGSAPSDDVVVDVLLRPRSLYLLTGASRYAFAHAVLPAGAPFRGRAVPRAGRRLSLLVRDEPPAGARAPTILASGRLDEDGGAA